MADLEQDSWDFIREKAFTPLEKALDLGILREKYQGGEAVHQIFDIKEWSDLYTDIYNLCTTRSNTFSSQLYSDYADAVVEYVERSVCTALQGLADVELLEEFLYRFKNHRAYITWLWKFFMYLDRYHVKIVNEDPLQSKGWRIFLLHVYQKFNMPISKALVNVIRTHRDGRQVDSFLIKEVVRILVFLRDFGVDPYTNDFEQRFLEETKKYYIQRSEQWRSLSLPKYLANAEKVFLAEARRAEDYGIQESQLRLEETLRQSLLQNSVLEESAVLSLFRENRLDDLACLYRLYSKVREPGYGLDLIIKIFDTFCTKEARCLLDHRSREIARRREEGSGRLTAALLQQEVNDTRYIEQFMELYKRLKKFVVTCFSCTYGFSNSMKTALQAVFNEPVGPAEPRHPPEQLLNAFLDRHMRRKNAYEVSAAHNVVAQCIELFNLLNHKDVFGEGYRDLLAKRLLGDNSYIADLEKLCISRLKADVGPVFTAKMEGMMSDMEQGVVRQVEGYDPPFECNFRVLTKVHWPSFAEAAIVKPQQAEDRSSVATVFKPPQSISTSLEVFNAYYVRTHERRKLAWVFRQSLMTIGYNLADQKQENKIDITCNGHQGSLLLLFNEHNLLKIADIAEKLGLANSISYVKMLLASFIVGKFRIIESAHQLKGVQDADEFQLNLNFTTPTRKIKVPAPVVGEDKPQGKAEDDRSFVMEAAIVKIMKTRKRLSHTDLVSEVLEHVRLFRPSIPQLKACIESLLNREYLRRDDDDLSTYVYVS